MKTIILLLLVLYIPLLAQTENSTKPDPAGFVPNFYFDAYNYKGTDPGQTRVDVYVGVPFEGIHFLKSGESFSAAYNVTVSVFDEDKEKLQTEKRWTETIKSDSFEKTTSKSSFYLSLKSFNLVPATYLVRVEVEDQDTKKNVAKEGKLTVRDFSKKTTDVSDILLIAQQLVVDGNKRMVPNITRNVAANKEGISLYYEIYAASPSAYSAVYSIKDSKDKELFSKTETVDVKQGDNPVNYKISVPELNLGEYKLGVALKDNGGNTLAETEKSFVSRWVGIPSTINDLDKAVDQMTYIAKASELDHIKDAPNKEEKQKRYIEFWKSKDPSPNTEENEVFEEYYRRVAYANDHFKSYLEGWRSDMGMVFITLGPPNNVERYPYEIDSKPYEVWDYYDINKRFVFVDQTGFGDYRLSNPVYGSWWKYRP